MHMYIKTGINAILGKNRLSFNNILTEPTDLLKEFQKIDIVRMEALAVTSSTAIKQAHAINIVVTL